MRYIIVGVLAILAVACSGGGGGEGRLLHLRGYDITEADYRTYVHGVLASSLGKAICRDIVGKTDDQRAQELAYPASGIWPIVPPNAIPQPSRDAVYPDALVAVGIT